jgi:nicotinate-nucleotide--dimethylbenzimidazole phosphoribosyltransferase
MPPRLPVDAVVFEPGALVDLDGAGDDRARSGARRLLAALAQADVHVAVLHEPARPGGPPGADAARLLADAGFAEPRVGAWADLRPELPSDRTRTLLVTAAAGPLTDAGPAAAAAPGTAGPAGSAGDTAASVSPGAGPEVACPPGQPVHRAVLGWLAAVVGPFVAARHLCGPLDEASRRGAEERQLRLTKPPGSLGRLEAIGSQLAGIAGEVPPPLPRPAAVAVFAGDHGVHRQGVSPWPQEVTTQMVANIAAGGAAINVLAGQAGAEVVVVDVAVAGDLSGHTDVPAATGASLLLDRRIRPGTADLATGPAMTPDEVRRALDVGAEVAVALVERGARCLVTGDMGIANTTPATALIAALTGRPAPSVTGAGAGLGDDRLDHKAAVVATAAARAVAAHGPDARGDAALGVLAEVGGLEHAALAGFIVAGAALQVPVVIDGVIAAAALLVATRLAPGVEAAVIAGHRSVEPGSSAVLAELGLEPMVDLGLRLGEGTGAALALPLVEAAARVLGEMATFDQAGVSGKAT